MDEGRVKLCFKGYASDRTSGGRKARHTQAAAQLGVPTVVIHGKDDAAIPVETGVQVENRIPHAKLVRLPAVGHCPPLEAPSAVATEVIQLAEVGLSQYPEEVRHETTGQWRRINEPVRWRYEERLAILGQKTPR